MSKTVNEAAIGILGGTFDPVHNGHLSIARAVNQHFGLRQTHLLPTGVPVHRAPPQASAEHRLAMLRLAVAPYPELAVDTRELDSARRNYMLWTLQSLRAEFPQAPLLLVLGGDAFAQLPSWYEWRALFDLAHLVVINRGDKSRVGAYNEMLQAELAVRQTKDTSILKTSLGGAIHHLTLPLHPASSTAIRAALARSTTVENDGMNLANLLPTAVLAYIARHSLYQASIPHGS